jgi:hypothetical protein
VRSQRFDSLPNSRKVLLMLGVSLQVSLAISAWADLAERPAEQVNGRKAMWALVIGVNFVGPLLYFWKGRRPAEVAPA